MDSTSRLLEFSTSRARKGGAITQSPSRIIAALSLTFEGAADSIAHVLDAIRDLLKLIEGTDIVEIEVEKDGLKVRIKKAGAVQPLVVGGPATPLPTVPTPSPAPMATPAPSPHRLELEPGQVLVSSPFVGTFYRAPAPNAKPFVDIGEPVKKGQPLCIVEAMKLMNEIEAEVDGEIVSILRENGTTVEYGEPLMIIKRG